MLIDITGQRFGKLVVLRRDFEHPNKQNAYWICLCDCGGTTSANSKNLRAGTWKKCGDCVALPPEVKKRKRREYKQANKDKNRIQDRERYHKDPLAHLERQRRWRLDNPERTKIHQERDKAKRRGQHNEWALKKLGITKDEYQKMLADQDGVCAICWRPEKILAPCKTRPRRLAVDHCHTTGRVRGLLCGACNKALGQFNDDTELLERAISYLNESGKVDGNDNDNSR